MGFFSEHSPKKIVIVLGHPNPGPTLSGELALMYEAAAKKAGHEVRRFNLADLRFDPILHHGYKAIQELEPDLLKVQEALRWCDHFVIIYPNWWSTMPALLKGMFDRLWLPGFAFNMRKDKNGKPTIGWYCRLKGKSARVIILSGNHPWLVRWVFGDFSNEVRNAILRFAGFRTRVTHVGPTDQSPEWKRNEWRRKVARLGRMGE